MMTLAFWLFTAAVLIGAAMSVRHMRGMRLPPRAIALGHGLLGAAGLAALIFAFVEGERGDNRYGVASFVPVAVVLAALALLLGLRIAVLARKPGRSLELIIGLHATLAVSAYMLLLVYHSLV